MHTCVCDINCICHIIIAIDVWKIERQNGKELEIGSAARYRMLENGQVLSVEGANLRLIFLTKLI